jgi:hypothetical protein
MVQAVLEAQEEMDYHHLLQVHQYQEQLVVEELFIVLEQVVRLILLLVQPLDLIVAQLFQNYKQLLHHQLLLVLMYL